MRPSTVMVLGIALLLSACNVERQAESPLNGTRSPVGATDSTKALAVIPTVARSNGDSGYRRESFGRPWLDVDGNGCNQRDDVLLRDAVPGTARSVRQGACAHDVIAGTWLDPYTGVALTFSDLKELAQAQAIQIDHVVPLAEAWVSGASSWSAEQRERYANDLGSLLAVDGPTNASKGSHDPAAWRPKKEFQCDYARRWVAVKSAWSLGVDPSERRALNEMLGVCG